MKRHKQYKLKLNFPFLGIVVLLFYLFILVCCIWQYNSKGEIEYLWIACGAVIAKCFFGWRFNKIYKSFEIDGEVLAIRDWFGFNSMTLKKQDIKGYKIKEVYTSYGIDYYIYLVPLEGNEIEFNKDSYANYERLVVYLKNFGLTYIGVEKLNSRYKHQIGMITVWCSAISIMLFFLLQLLKFAK